MNKIYSSPFRVYLIIGSLALAGIFFGSQLPVSLFPNSTKPVVWVSLKYGGVSAKEFLDTYGKTLESNLRSISTDSVQVEKLGAEYMDQRVDYEVQFKWGVSPLEAQKEVQNAAVAFSSRLPAETRDSLRINLDEDNRGFFAMSLFSDERSLTDLYDTVEPIIAPKMVKVLDAEEVFLWNPSSQEVRVEIKPNSISALQIIPKDIELALLSSMSARNGGAIQAKKITKRRSLL